ncbi:MAG: hypothetical protein JWQ14_1505 [Adhaeribacter sp.]|nr:hypothetical protein [Adhaeribacter sp.]
MGKRQVRIFRKDIFLSKFEIEGKTGHVIMADHVVHNGLILQVTERHLVLRNPRFKEYPLNLDAIEEVVYDKETDY